MLVLIISCSGDRPIYKIGVSQPAGGIWRDKVNNEMLAAQHLYEQDVEVSIVEAGDDSERQARQIDSLTQAGIDLLVVAPSEAEPIAKAVDRTRRRGIPVIFFDRRADTDDYTAFIGGDNVEAGRTIARYVADHATEIAPQTAGRRPVVVEITGFLETSAAKERHQGFSEVMKERPEVDYRCAVCDWTHDKTQQVMREQLALTPRPDIVFCHNDPMGYDAWQVIEEAGLERDIRLIGIDGLPGPDQGIDFVERGILAATYVYPTHGEKIVRLALDILNDSTYERENKLPGIIISRENVEQMGQTSNELSEQVEHLVTIHDKLDEYLGLYNAQRRVLFVLTLGVALLIVAIALILRAFIQMRRTLHERQQMNEEQTLFLTNSDGRRLRQVVEMPREELPPVRSQDTIFAETLNEAIRKNMSNPNLKMEELGETVGLSRVQLYRKVKAITGLSPVELLRQMRLQQGYVLLSTTNKTVNEIAYEVGFGTPGYFSKCFKQQFGKYPTDLRAQPTDETGKSRDLT